MLQEAARDRPGERWIRDAPEVLLIGEQQAALPRELAKHVALRQPVPVHEDLSELPLGRHRKPGRAFHILATDESGIDQEIANAR